MAHDAPLAGRWGLILGASSGFGAATSLALAKEGMNIFGVHLDRKSTMPNVEKVIADIEALGRRAIFFNVNAADAEKRAEVLDKVQEVVTQPGEPGHVYFMLHSLAFGTLRLFIGPEMKEAVNQAQMDMTLDVMAHSLVYWTQALYARKLLARGSRIFSMTSSGSHRVIDYYGAVSAAKAALESHTRQLALELAKEGVLVNCIQAGITDTPALRKIPGNEKLIEEALRRHPAGRVTVPEDVAHTLVALCDPRITWVSGEVIRVDGGEDVTI